MVFVQFCSIVRCMCGICIMDDRDALCVWRLHKDEVGQGMGMSRRGKRAPADKWQHKGKEKRKRAIHGNQQW